MSDLLKALRKFDGKAVTILSEARARFGGDPDFMGELVSYIDSQEPYVADGATWLIKDCLESGLVLKPKEVEALVARLETAPSWQAALHLCQVTEFLKMTPKQAGCFGEWAARFLDHERPFVRAWSMSTLQHVAQQAPDMTARAETALAAAERDTSASVRARARKIKARKSQSR